MPLYEIKLEIPPAQKQLLITQLSLEYVRSYTDTDTFLETPPGSPKEKIKRIDGVVKRYHLEFDGEMFVITGEIMSQARADDVLRGRKITAQINRKKDEYTWIELGIKVAFDTLEGVEDKLFFEVYSENRQLIEKAKTGLEAIGYSTWVQKMYDEVVG